MLRTTAFRIVPRLTATVAPRTAPSVLVQLGQSRLSSHQASESYEDFNARYADFFSTAQDSFEVARGLNNCLAYDLVPSVQVVEAAVRAARRVNDYAIAVRIFEGIKQKVENDKQYKQYLEETAALRKELGIELREELYGQK